MFGKYLQAKGTHVVIFFLSLFPATVRFSVNRPRGWAHRYPQIWHVLMPDRQQEWFHPIQFMIPDRVVGQGRTRVRKEETSKTPRLSWCTDLEREESLEEHDAGCGWQEKGCILEERESSKIQIFTECGEKGAGRCTRQWNMPWWHKERKREHTVTLAEVTQMTLEDLKWRGCGYRGLWKTQPKPQNWATMANDYTSSWALRALSVSVWANLATRKLH